jgi:SAM-dependent methyltransferase
MVPNLTSDDYESARDFLYQLFDNETFFPLDNDKEFAKRMFSNHFDYFLNELERFGFMGMPQIIDAGCGYGQWSLALAALNKDVLACDVSIERILLVNELKKFLKLSNLEALRTSISENFVTDSSADGIFSYGTIFCTPWKKTLEVFHNALRSNGILYFNFPTSDWFNFMWKTRHNECVDYKPREVVAQAFRNTIEYEKGSTEWNGQTIMEIDATVSFLEYLGFKNIMVGPYGTVRSNKLGVDYLDKYVEFNKVQASRGIIEILALKK